MPASSARGSSGALNRRCTSRGSTFGPRWCAAGAGGANRICIADGVMSAVVLSNRSFSSPWNGSLRASAYQGSWPAYKSCPRPRSSNAVPGTTSGDTDTSTLGDADGTDETTSMSGGGSVALSLSARAARRSTHLLELGLAQSRRLDVGCDTRPFSFGVGCAECDGGWAMWGECAGCPEPWAEWAEWDECAGCAGCAGCGPCPECSGGGGGGCGGCCAVWAVCAVCAVCAVWAVWCDSAGEPELMLPSSLRSGGRDAEGSARGLGMAPGAGTDPETVLVLRRLGRRTPRGRSKSQLVRRCAQRPHAGRTSSHWGAVVSMDGRSWMRWQ